ncbi:MAG: Hpt domain-containing protein [Pseudomonadota bacterium]
MDSNNEPVQPGHTGRLARAAESILQFFMRALTPVNNPLSVIPEVPELPIDTRAPKGRRHSFSGELFAELLIELPVHRRQILRAWEAGDLDTLRQAVHKLLGAVAYCDAPELEEAIRELRLALKTEDQHTIDVYHERALNVIDGTLRYSGYRGHG